MGAGSSLRTGRGEGSSQRAEKAALALELPSPSPRLGSAPHQGRGLYPVISLSGLQSAHLRNAGL